MVGNGNGVPNQIKSTRPESQVKQLNPVTAGLVFLMSRQQRYHREKTFLESPRPPCGPRTVVGHRGLDRDLFTL